MIVDDAVDSGDEILRQREEVPPEPEKEAQPQRIEPPVEIVQDVNNRARGTRRSARLGG